MRRLRELHERLELRVLTVERMLRSTDVILKADPGTPDIENIFWMAAGWAPSEKDIPVKTVGNLRAELREKDAFL